MSSDPKTDLIYAILAMDSYNRGYGAGISGLEDATDTFLGHYSINETAETLLAPGSAQNAGFYALAYEHAATGEVVISYRGTNFDPGDSVFKFFQSPLWADILSGWSVGAGLPGKQAVLALEFYNAVAPDGVDPRYANITTTGHSLGGGLAGFVANVFNRNAVLFDPMPYTPVSETLRTCLDARIPVWVRSVRGRQPGFDRLSLSGVCGARSSAPKPAHPELVEGCYVLAERQQK